MVNENTQTTPELIPVSKWNDFYPYPSSSALRQLIFYNTNEFNNSVVRRIGKRLYLKTSAFFEWVEDSNKAMA